MSNNERVTEFIIIIGYNGTGKTTLAKKILAAELKKDQGRALIVTPDDIEFPGIPEVNYRFKHRIQKYVKARKLIYYKGALQDISENFRQGLLIFDDCRAYLGAATDQELHNLLIRRRQRELDMIAVGHGFTDIPPKFFTFASHIILFLTKDNIYKRKEVIRDFDRICQAVQRVNEKALENRHHYEILKM